MLLVILTRADCAGERAARRRHSAVGRHRPSRHGACEILGFDPLYVANEGRFVAFVPAAEVERALAVLAAHPVSAGAVRIGRVSPAPAGLVTLKSRIGATRVVDRLSGEQLPRIC